MSTLVCRLISARLDAQLSMEEVAAASGLSVEYLSLIETGRTSPPVHTTTRLHNTIAEAAFEKQAAERQAAEKQAAETHGPRIAAPRQATAYPPRARQLSR